MFNINSAALTKKLLALVCAATITASLAGCGDTSYALKVDGEEIPAGIYVLNQVNALNDAQSKEGFDSQKPDVWENKIEEKPLDEWISARAKELTLEYAQVEKMYKESGFELSKTDKESVDYSLESGWSNMESSYNKLGISKSSYKKLLENTYKRRAIFDDYYGSEGSETVDETALMDHYKSDYAQVKLISFSTYDTTTSAAMTDEAKKVVEENANKYLERAKAGEDMAKLINERAAEIARESSSTVPEIDATQTYMQTIKKGEESYTISEKLNNSIFDSAKIGEPILLNDDNAYYIVYRYDVAQDKAAFESMKFNLLYDLKGEGFNTIIADKSKELKVEVNDNAIKAFDPKKLAKA